MLVKLVEIQRGSRHAGYSSRLNVVYLNPRHIISIAEDSISNENLLEEAVKLGLSEQVSFCRVTIHEGNQPRTLTIVGSSSEIHQKLINKSIYKHETVPMIVEIDTLTGQERFIGGYTNLIEYFKKQPVAKQVCDIDGKG